jgi:hypothetical protein
LATKYTLVVPGTENESSIVFGIRQVAPASF